MKSSHKAERKLSARAGVPEPHGKTFPLRIWDTPAASRALMCLHPSKRREIQYSVLQTLPSDPLVPNAGGAAQPSQALYELCAFSWDIKPSDPPKLGISNPYFNSLLENSCPVCPQPRGADTCGIPAEVMVWTGNGALEVHNSAFGQYYRSWNALGWKGP